MRYAATLLPACCNNRLGGQHGNGEVPYRVAVAGQGDPIVGITCISHPSGQATIKAHPAAPAAELQLDGVTGEDEGLEGGLEGDLEGKHSAEGLSADTGVLYHSNHCA